MNTPAADAGTRYHHGDLANQLLVVAAEVIAEHGAAGFSLREVARRAGVSHAAPAHHYGDATGLLTALAIDGFRHLHAAMETATEGIGDPIERLAAIARAYVEIARSNPGHCAVLFRHDLVDATDETYRQAGDTAFDDLHSAVQRVADTLNPELDVDTASLLCWSMVQGVVQLHPSMISIAAQAADKPPVPDLGDLAEIFARLMVDGLAGRAT